MIFLVIVLMLGTETFERREPMPNVSACWARATETWTEMLKQHPEMKMIGVGCTLETGEPA